MNRFVKEVFDSHELIQRWLGENQAPQAVCDELLRRFSPYYSMVTLTGNLLDYPQLSAFFAAQRGAKAGLQIAVEDPVLLRESADHAVVMYKERQQLPGQAPTLRMSTVVFETDTHGRVLWRHLHETAAE